MENDSVVRSMTHGELIFQGSWIVQYIQSSPTHESWVVQPNLGYAFSMHHGSYDSMQTPWVMDRTIVLMPMGHGSYDSICIHGSWIVRQYQDPWVMGRTTVSNPMHHGLHNGIQPLSFGCSVVRAPGHILNGFWDGNTA